MTTSTSTPSTLPAPNPGAHLLVVEDDPAIADMLTNYLHMHGYITTVCGHGVQAVELARTLQPALMVLDLMLPGQDGIAVCEQVRAFSAVPIIMVTARVDEIDRLLGLDTGADDYVCKPFSPREVVARIKALLRRAQLSALAAGTQGGGSAPSESGLEVRPDSQSFVWNGHPLPFTGVEYRLLRLMVSRPEKVFSRAMLLDQLHDDLRDVSDRAIDSHIKNIRRKLEAAGAEQHTIVSVYGVGYRYERSA